MIYTIAPAGIPRWEIETRSLQEQSYMISGMRKHVKRLIAGYMAPHFALSCDSVMYLGMPREHSCIFKCNIIGTQHPADVVTLMH